MVKDGGTINPYDLLGVNINTSLNDVKKLENLAKKNNKMLFVDYPFLFSGSINYIKEVIDSRKYGNFLRSKYYKSLKREIIIDDYFKFIINNKLIKASFIKLKNYIHIGSLVEYQEYEYWHKYFK